MEGKKIRVIILPLILRLRAECFRGARGNETMKTIALVWQIGISGIWREIMGSILVSGKS